MQPAKQYRLNCITESTEKVIYLTKDLRYESKSRLSRLDIAAIKRGYKNYEDFQAKRQRAGEAVVYVILIALFITIISGIYVAFQSFGFLSSFVDVGRMNR